MREVVIRNWCDVCDERGERAEATVIFTVAISESGTHGGTARVVETCELHAKEIRDVQRLAIDRGVPPQNIMMKTTRVKSLTPGAAPDAQCPLCAMPLTKTALIGHLRGRHGASVVVQPDKCPTCGYPNDTAQGMATHRARAHGYSLLADTLATIGRALDGSPIETETRTTRTSRRAEK